MSTTSVPVGTTATLLIAANPKRIYLKIQNKSGEELFWGDNNGVTTASGMGLADDASEVFEAKTEVRQYVYKGALYGVLASGASADVRVLELEDSQ